MTAPAAASSARKAGAEVSESAEALGAEDMEVELAIKGSALVDE
jgi:hypothetical protein